MTQLHTYLKSVYREITKGVVKSWITSKDEFGRGILRRLDYAYGFTQENGNPLCVKPEDVNEKEEGLLQILRKVKANKKINNAEVDYFINRVEETCIAIKKLHCSFLIADYENFHQDANTFLNRFYSQMNDPSKGQTLDLPRKKSFYRLRNMGCIKRLNLKRIDLFHIPFEMRYLMGTYRYSIPGYPSLYCSSSLYCAWEEIEQETKENHYAVATFQTKDVIRLLDLRWLFRDNKLVNSENLLKHYILRLPLIIACSMQVKYSSDKFVPEYIFSQQIFQWLMSQLRKQSSNTMGVIYTSSKESIWEEFCKEGHKTSTEEITNYAFLAYTDLHERPDYSIKLASKLKIRVPIWLKPCPAKKRYFDILKETEKELTTSATSKYISMSNYIEKDN